MRFDRHYCFCALCAIVGALLAMLLFLGSVPSARAEQPKKPVSFIEDVAPILQENCMACHDSKKRKGKLDLTTFADMRRGGRSEIDPIVPGKPEESYLVELMREEGVGRMPPKDSGDAVPEEKIALVERWIKEGAKLDQEIKPEADLVRELRVRWQPPVPPVAYKYPVAITAVAFSPDGTTIVAGGHHEITVRDVATGTLEKRMRTRAERIYGVAFLPDGKLVAVGGRPGQEGDVSVYDLEGKAEERDGVKLLDGVNDPTVLIAKLLEADDVVLTLDVSADGKKLVTGGSDRMVHVWDMSKGYAETKPEQTIENHADWVFGVRFTPDGKRLVTCSRDKTAKVWDLEKKESVTTFPDHQAPVFGVTTDPSGNVAYSVGEDKQVRSWSTKDGKAAKNGGGHGATIFKVLYHKERKRLLTCAADKTVRLWEPGAMKLEKTLSGHGDWVYTMALNGDGSRLVSAGYDGEIRLWNVAEGKLIRAFNGTPGLTSEPQGN